MAMALGLFELVAGLVALSLLIYYHSRSKINYWRSRGVKGPRPLPIFGTGIDFILGRKSLAEYTSQIYESYKDEPYIGIFNAFKPALMIRDPELIKDVLIKDFSTFNHRGVNAAIRAEPLTQHLVFLEPERWRPLRKSISPTFTSGKLKDMFYLLEDCAKHLDSFLEGYAKKNPVIECRELAAKFTTDVIGVCAFGLDMRSIAEEESEFRKVARAIFSASTFNFIRNQLRITAPWLLNLLSPIFYDRYVNGFFIGSIRQTMEYRRKNKVKRHDFIDLLMDIKDDPSKVNNIELTETLIAAQAFVFFLAGFETSSSAISHALFELAKNQPLQDKLREDILEGLKSSNGEVTYEKVKNMKYLHKVFCETLRMYPPLSILQRNAMKPYAIPERNVTIPKNTIVWIPVYAIHHDPLIYPDPETFDPERFNEENVKQRHPSFYLPFGDGPRNCIGARFGNYQSKVGLIHILKNYKVDVCDQTRIPYQINPRNFLLTPIDGIKLKFQKIN